MKNERLQILQVHNYYQIPGGEDTVVENEKHLLEEHGHTVIQYTRYNKELKEFSKFRKLLLPFSTIFNPRTYRDVKRIIREEKIDVVHVHNTLNLISPAVYYAALKCKVPVVQTVHNFRLLCPGATFYRDGHICEDCVKKGLGCAIMHSCYRGSKAQTLVCVLSTWLHRLTGIYGKLNYICLTEFNREKLLQLKQIKPERIFVKPNFTLASQIDKKSGRHYLYVGRIEQIKGIPLLLDAFAAMPEVKLIIAGYGDLSDYVQQRIEKERLDHIEYVGFLNHSELNQLLSETKAVIVPSQWLEPFGMTVIEAFAAGVPVIAGDVGSLHYLVQDGRNGFRFQYDSASALTCVVQKMEAVCCDPLSEQKMWMETLKSHNRYYSENKNMEYLTEIYNAVSKPFQKTSGGGTDPN